MESDHEIKMRAVKARFNPFDDKIEFAFMERRGEHYSAADSLHMITHDEDMMTPSFCTLDVDQAQLLMDDLWNCGLRPSEGSGSARSMKATQNHLADLKKILFHKLGIEK